MADPFILWFEECDASRVGTVGGKCAGLGEMVKAGVTVPPGFAVTTSAHRAFLERSRLDERIARLLADVDLEDIHSLESASGAIRGTIESAGLPEDVERAVRDAYEGLASRCGDRAVPVAVRSSAVSEDLAGASFAGQLETFLWVLGADEVVRRTVSAWAGLFTPSALAYRARMGFKSEHALMSVGVQQMVEPRAAGVMFTLNPVNGDYSKIAVEASWGLGESVVHGDVNPDRYLVDKVTLEIIERAIAVKDIEYRFDPERGEVVPTPLPEERRGAPCLSDDDAIELARVGKRIERHYGSPRDVEWALAEGRGEVGIRILQCRAETVWSQTRREKPIAEKKGSAVEYVLAQLMELSGARPSAEEPKESEG